MRSFGFSLTLGLSLGPSDGLLSGLSLLTTFLGGLSLGSPLLCGSLSLGGGSLLGWGLSGGSLLGGSLIVKEVSGDG